MIADASSEVVAVLGRVDAGLEQSRERLFDLLRIPSISTQPEHDRDIQRAAEWLRDQLAGLGSRSRSSRLRGILSCLAIILDRPARKRRASCSMVITTCSRRIRWNVGPARPSSRSLWTVRGVSG